MTVPCGRPVQRPATIGGQSVSYELHRSARRRKTLSLQVQHGSIRVLAPQRTSQASIEAFLQEREEWIAERLRLVPLSGIRAQLRPGGELLLLGRARPVRQGPKTFELVGEPTDEGGAYFRLNPDAVDMVDQASVWFRTFARRHFQARIAEWSAPVGVAPRRLRMAQQKTRWGSASARGTLSLNWQLVFAPPKIIDYVVVHELCHFKRLDHSPEFWALVAEHLPDYQQRRGWLNRNGDQLRW